MTTTITGERPGVRSFAEHEHEELARGIERIHEVVADLPSISVDRIAGRVDGVIRWLDETLQPHMSWEDTWLFPQIDERAQTPWATKLVRFDHRQIVRQAQHLAMHRRALVGGPSHEATAEIRTDLIGLEALLRANLEREEEFLLPLLDQEVDRWTPEWRD
jgi:iron-sulfur cluster repair protein YtfE (RIC family)